MYRYLQLVSSNHQEIKMNTLEVTQIQLQPLHRKLLRRAQAYEVSKRGLDIAVAVVALTVLAPFLLVIFTIVRLTSPGKALYWQERVGLNGRIIKFPKIRSMVQDADHLVDTLKEANDHSDSVTFKMKKDPRITPIGRFIRKFSIDELPQLWLVLTGDLSLVGPRPALVREVEQYNYLEKQRLLVKPGLTCIWQVSGRGDIAFKKQVLMDLQYIKDRSLITDIKLLILTVPAVFTGRGAY